MKKFSKILSVALLVALVLSLGATSAFAGSITITRDQTYDSQSTGARTYTAYKVFDSDKSLSGTNTQAAKDPTYSTNGPIAYTMASDSLWKTAMLDENQTWFDVTPMVDGNYSVTLKSGVDNNATTAKAIANYLNANIPAGLTGTEINPGTAATVDNGYYLIVASDGAPLLTLVTTNVTIVEKNPYISTHKTTSQTSYTVGQPITYTATVTIPADTALTQTDSETGAYLEGHGPIILHDTMVSQLTFKEDVTATVDGTAFTGFTKSYGENATAKTDDTCTFELFIPVTNALLGKTITFTYTAEINSTAVDPDTGFINELGGEHNGYKTNPDKPIVYTFDFDFSKTFVGSEDTTLKATFELCTTQTGKKTENSQEVSSALSFIPGSTAGSYIKADSDDTTGVTTVIESANNAAINVQGLAAGTYYLIEKTTSTGYNMLAGPVTVVITDETQHDQNGNVTGEIKHTVTLDGKASTELAPAKIENRAGTVLPSTGGIGTTIFYVVGGILVVAAGVLLITKKRMSE